jgi:hypothetical protein
MRSQIGSQLTRVPGRVAQVLDLLRIRTGRRKLDLIQDGVAMLVDRIAPDLLPVLHGVPETTPGPQEDGSHVDALRNPHDSGAKAAQRGGPRR